jgi:hypothetical protein
MNGVTQKNYLETETSAKIVRSGSVAEGVAGAVGIILAIIGLLQILPHAMLPIATIVVGLALLFEGGSIASRFGKLLNETAKGRFETSEMGVGLTTEVVGGIAAIILGVLALLNINAAALMPISAIVLGVTLIFGSGIMARLNHLQMPKSAEYDSFREVAHEAVGVATGAQIMLGLGALILGIIGVSGISWMILTYVALLCVGLAELTSGSAIASRMMAVMH